LSESYQKDSPALPQAVIPSSTYRLQLHQGFTFDDAAQIADYLKDLGISHIYSSPYLQAAPGSMHGYDVVDPTKVNDELGGECGHRRFCQRLGELGLGQILDIVPNHMAVSATNPYWWDVLENGEVEPVRGHGLTSIGIPPR
jgi:(1->4)-alpha-D-glucan 1-alpha-D-glucosylmutase